MTSHPIHHDVIDMGSWPVTCQRCGAGPGPGQQMESIGSYLYADKFASGVLAIFIEMMHSGQNVTRYI